MLFSIYVFLSLLHLNLGLGRKAASLNLLFWQRLKVVSMYICMASDELLLDVIACSLSLPGTTRSHNDENNLLGDFYVSPCRPRE